MMLVLLMVNDHGLGGRGGSQDPVCSSFLDAGGAGMAVVITCRGKPIAELVRALLAVNARSPTNAGSIKSISPPAQAVAKALGRRGSDTCSRKPSRRHQFSRISSPKENQAATAGTCGVKRGEDFIV
jgi:antitoxin (DNA-binding transcriptional repressor) of toxin-antitoxin stability system